VVLTTRRKKLVGGQGALVLVTYLRGIGGVLRERRPAKQKMKTKPH